jgi:transposase
MRVLQIDFPEGSIEALDALLKQTKDVRVFRRAQAVRQVVKGRTIQAVAETFHYTYSALRTWVYRFARQGIQGLHDRPRPGRPRKITAEVEACILRLLEEDPLEQGSVFSQWNCRELGLRVAHHTGVQVSRESVRRVLKNRVGVTTAPQAHSILIPRR